MWEIFSKGKTPYKGHSPIEATELIKKGKLLPRPTDISELCYELMTKCWNKKPESRPSFDEIHEKLNNLF
jgi:hypothetical protein